MTYKRKYKELILEYLEKGYSCKVVANMFGIGTTTLTRWKRMEKAGESLETKGRKRKPKKVDPEKLRMYVKEHPNAYIREIAEEFNCAQSSICVALKKHKIKRRR